MIEFNKDYTYKQSCELLNETQLSGSKQRTQIKKWSEIYKIDRPKKGHYIFIKKYNDVELIEHQTYFKSKSYVTAIMCTLLMNTPRNVINVNMGRLLEILNFVNSNFKKAKYNYDKTMSYVLEQEEEDIGDLLLFIEDVEKMSKRLVKDVLNDMQDKRLLYKIDYLPMFAYKEKMPNGQIVTFTHEANEEMEMPHFIEAQRQVLKHFRDKDNPDEKWDEMCSRLNWFQWQDAKIIMTNHLKDKLGISYFYYNYKIILNKEGIGEEITENFTQMQRSFNLYMQDKIMNSKMIGLQLIPNEHKEKYIQILVDNQCEIDVKEDNENFSA